MWRGYVSKYVHEKRKTFFFLSYPLYLSASINTYMRSLVIIKKKKRNLMNLLYTRWLRNCGSDLEFLIVVFKSDENNIHLSVLHANEREREREKNSTFFFVNLNRIFGFLTSGSISISISVSSTTYFWSHTLFVITNILRTVRVWTENQPRESLLSHLIRCNGVTGGEVAAVDKEFMLERSCKVAFACDDWSRARCPLLHLMRVG